MKKLVLYIVLLSYTIVMCKPVLPYVSDFVGHVFFYAHHMATVHYENGKMHIHKEIVDNAKKEASQKELPSSKKDNTETDHISIQQIKFLHSPFVNTSHNFIQASPLLQNCLSGDYPPPRA